MSKEDVAPGERAAPDPRPQPAYGEYATPEEQRARIGRPDPALTPQTTPATEAAAVSVTAVTAAPARAVAKAGTRRPRLADRIATIALLTYGLFNVFSSVPAFIDFSSYTDALSRVLGTNIELTDVSAAQPWGIAAAIVMTVGWIATAAISWWSMSRGRLTWWIPLVAGVVFTVITGILVMIPLMNDPSVWNSLLDSVR